MLIVNESEETDPRKERNQNPSLAHHPEKTKSIANIRVYVLPDNFLPIHI